MLNLAFGKFPQQKGSGILQLKSISHSEHGRKAKTQIPYNARMQLKFHNTKPLVKLTGE